MSGGADDAGRAVSGLERVWLAAGRMAPPFAITLDLDWAGPVDAARWRVAFEAAFAAHPALRVRLRGHLRKAHWSVTDVPPPVAEADGALDPGRGPVAAITLTAQGWRVRALHAVTDGRGLLAFVEDAVRAYHGEAVEGLPAGPLSDAELSGDGAASPEPPADRPPPFGPCEGQPRVVLEALPDVQGRCVPRLCALLYARSRAFTQHPLRVSVPVDLRPHLNARTGGNLTGIVHLELDSDDATRIAASLDAAVARGTAVAHARAANGVREVPLWLMTAVGRREARRHARTGLYPVSTTISWLGRHALTVDGAPVTVRLIPPPAPGVPIMLGAIAGHGALQLAWVGPGAPTG